MGNSSLTRGDPDRHRAEDSSKTSSTTSDYSREEKKLMKTYLKDFVCSKPSTRQELNIILHHWENLVEEVNHGIGGTLAAIPARESRVGTICDRFQEILFELAPDLRPMFHSTVQFKGRMLMNIIGGIKSLLQTRDSLERAARIAQRHVSYGVKGTHFNSFGIAFLTSLQEAAPELYTRQVAKAWKSVYCHVASMVLVVLDKELKQSRRRVSKIQSSHEPELVSVNPHASAPSYTTKGQTSTAVKPRRSSMPSIQQIGAQTAIVPGGSGVSDASSPKHISASHGDTSCMALLPSTNGLTKKETPRSIHVRRNSNTPFDSVEVSIEAPSVGTDRSKKEMNRPSYIRRHSSTPLDSVDAASGQLTIPRRSSGSDFKAAFVDYVWTPFLTSRRSLRVGVDPKSEPAASTVQHQQVQDRPRTRHRTNGDPIHLDGVRHHAEGCMTDLEERSPPRVVPPPLVRRHSQTLAVVNDANSAS